MTRTQYITKVHENLIEHLVTLYNKGDGYLAVSRLCDETLDRSGRLLGEVRKLAIARR